MSYYAICFPSGTVDTRSISNNMAREDEGIKDAWQKEAKYQTGKYLVGAGLTQYIKGRKEEGYTCEEVIVVKKAEISESEEMIDQETQIELAKIGGFVLCNCCEPRTYHGPDYNDLNELDRLMDKVFVDYVVARNSREYMVTGYYHIAPKSYDTKKVRAISTSQIEAKAEAIIKAGG